MSLDPVATVAVLSTSATAAALAALAIPPTRRLAGRVRPYALESRTRLGRSADLATAVVRPATSGGGTLRRLFAPPITAVARVISRYVDAASEDTLASKLRHASMLTEVPEPERVQEFRTRQVGMSAGWAVAGLGGALAAGMAPISVLGVAVLGFVAGVARSRGRLDAAIADRRERMRIELYTVNQLIAMNIRVGGGVVQAITRVVERADGELVDELREAVRAHASGVDARTALGNLARSTPEPFAARTYRLLASGVEYGSDLATALLAHSDDIREARRDAMRRMATRRRATMLVPIITILAPVMLLFIAAPLPSIVFGTP